MEGVDDWDKAASFVDNATPRRSTSSLDAMIDPPLRKTGEERTLTQHQVTRLLQILCIDLGFCLPANDAVKLELNPPRTVEGFTRAVFRAEGLDPALADRKLYDQVRGVVAGAFDGTARSDV
jgi:hypothetical protein